jgi:hypothetical protein
LFNVRYELISHEAGQAPLFYAFSLEDHVSANHLLRGIEGALRALMGSTRTRESTLRPLGRLWLPTLEGCFSTE